MYFSWGLALKVYLGFTFCASFLVAWTASQRGREGAGWWFVSMLFGPGLALLALLAAPPADKPPTHALAGR